MKVLTKVTEIVGNISCRGDFCLLDCVVEAKPDKIVTRMFNTYEDAKKFTVGTECYTEINGE